jgi:alcohol dehydrogenase
LEFESFHPTRLIFGPGRFSEAGRLARGYGRRVLVVTSRSAMARLGYTQQLIEYLENEDVVASVFHKLDPTPSLENVDEGAEFARQHRADLIIGLGGGSALDCAKAIAAVAPGLHPCMDYLYGKADVSHLTLPILAIPTTAGTGSETNRAAILTDRAGRHKDALRSDFLFPRTAIVDSQLTHYVPPLITAHTGFDAFAHALESFVSPKAQPLASALAQRAMQTIIKWLPIALAEPQHAKARESLMLASSSMGYNLSCVGTCLPHRLDKPLCARFPQIAHGQAVAFFYPAWAEKCWRGAPQRFACVARWLNPELAGRSTIYAAKAFAACVRVFITRLGLNPSFIQLGLELSELELADLAAGVRGDLRLNPLPVRQEQVIDFYRQALLFDTTGV